MMEWNDNMNKIFNFFKEAYLEHRLNKEIVYYIQINNSVAGFFAVLRAVLDYCCYAEENGYMPYVKYGKDILYSENTFFLGTNNPFEYYFRQPSVIPMWGLNIIKSQLKHADNIELKYNLKPLSYIVEDTYIERMSSIYRKYLHLNEVTDKKIRRSIRHALKGKRTLGVHIRGTDFYKEFNNHPVPVTVDEYVMIINEELGKGNYEQVFVATDDKRCLKELKERIQVPLIYYKNIMRAENNKSVAFERSERKNNNYLLGFEVLRDVYTLVACEGFIGCLSQIDIFVQIIKMSEGQRFTGLKIIDKGILVNNRQCWEPTK